MTLMLTVIIFSTLSFPTPAAGSDELKRGLLEDIISVDKPELFDDYGELYLAKAETQAVIQGMEGKDVTWDTKEWMDILLRIIDDFEEMADLSKSSVTSDHIEAIEIGDRINTSINTLSGYDIPKESRIPMFSELALKRFYQREGEHFENLSRNEKETKVKIEYENISSVLYKKGGIDTISDASWMELKLRRDEWVYKRDMKRASEYINASWSHLDNARNPSSGFFGAAFMEIIKARDSFEKAEKIGEEHSDKEPENIYLFSIDAGLEGDLNESIISENLNDIFKANGYSLSSYATVAKGKEYEWMIIDEEEKFIVKKEFGTLNIYRNIKALRSNIDDTYHKLMLDMLKVIAIYLLILSFFTAILWKDFKRWGEELDDTRLGEELVV
jgi:hypothetical protein